MTGLCVLCAAQEACSAHSHVNTHKQQRYIQRHQHYIHVSFLSPHMASHSNCDATICQGILANLLITSLKYQIIISVDKTASRKSLTGWYQYDESRETNSTLDKKKLKTTNKNTVNK